MFRDRTIKTQMAAEEDKPFLEGRPGNEPFAWWQCMVFQLVVEPYPPEKYDFVNGKDDIPYIMENKKCSKPPTSIC